ncbi:unnamed protein product [Rotaria magnacalcarata]|uniref:Reverse transcriptase n=2 Tax=Rotaria magnacalcarata TaxID=392030 RepID=A0A816TXP8_9BILA|nr:unnamed protein product [Rotaria magnacalcarata]
MKQFCQWGFQEKDQKLVEKILVEWFTSGTLENILLQWENNSPKEIQIERTSLNILCYNVQGWGSRCLEVIDIAYKVEASICVFTEAGELWNTSRVPHFNIFHQHGTNKSGGVCVAIGKHLKGTRIEINVENTVIIDVNGLSETIRVIAIYCPAGQIMMLEDLEPYIIENTIITGDFNASIKEWGSESSDKRGRNLKKWVEKNNLCYIPSTLHSSKRSNRNIDLSFTNIDEVRGETLKMGTSDHWPLLITCENVGFDKNKMFPHVNWKAYEAILTLLQDFWTNEQNRGMQADEWYMNYVRFLAALKVRLTQWKEKEKFRPSLPPYLIQKLKELKPKKSSGFDAVSNFIIKRIPPGYISCLVNRFNTWINEHRYPDMWKLAKIVTLNKLKAGIPRCDQTRPISLLATHSKLFEKIMLERLRYWAETNRLVPADQSGFRPGCLLQTRVLSIYREVKNNMTVNIPTLAVYVDYQKAYDKVWHNGLVVKLNRMGHP